MLSLLRLARPDHLPSNNPLPPSSHSYPSHPVNINRFINPRLFWRTVSSWLGFGLERDGGKEYGEFERRVRASAVDRTSDRSDVEGKLEVEKAQAQSQSPQTQSPQTQSKPEREDSEDEIGRARLEIGS